MRRLARRASRTRDLAARGLARLKRPPLIEDVADALQLTATGRKRYDASPNAAGLHDATSYGNADMLTKFTRKARA